MPSPFHFGNFPGPAKGRSAMFAIEVEEESLSAASETEFNSRSAGRRYSRISERAKETPRAQVNLPD